MPLPSDRARARARDLALVAALALAVYAPSLGGAFVYDDVPLLREDRRVREGALALAVTTPYWELRAGGLYRPVTTLSFVLNGYCGKGPFPFRAVNLVLHAASSALALVLARRVLASRRAAFLAAALFAVHPIHVEVAANGVGRGESLGLLLAGSAWLLAVPSARRGKASGLALATLLAALGALAKESAVLVALAAPLEVAFLEASVGPRRRAALAALAGVPALLAALVALALRVEVLGPALAPPLIASYMNPLAPASLAVRLANSPFLVLAYLEHLAWPFRLAPDYGGRFLDLASSPSDPRVFGRALGALAVLVAPALAVKGRGRALAFAAAFFLLSLGAVLQVVPIGTLLADRLAYAPSLAFALAFGALGHALLARSPGVPHPILPPFRGEERRNGCRHLGWHAPRAVLALILGVLGGAACADAIAWGDNVRLFERARERARGSVQVQIVLGCFYVEEADRREKEGAPPPEVLPLLARAVEPFEEAIHLWPDEPEPYLHLGRILRLLGRPDAARRRLEDGLARQPRSDQLAPARFELGMTLLAMRDLAAAERELSASASLSPDARTFFNLGQVRRELGDREGARAALTRSLELDPAQTHVSEIRKILGELDGR